MKPFSLSGAFLLAASAATSAFVAEITPTPSQQRAAMVERIMPAVVAVEPEDGLHKLIFKASGFIFDADKGYIFTNAHVVGDPALRFVRIALRDGSRFDAKIIGRDAISDVAVLQIQGRHGPLSQVRLGNSDTVRIATDSMAIGAPFGFNNSVTTGIVSALHRQINDRVCADYVQTDAAIGDGSSGGPLIDDTGAVIGINSATASNHGDYAGLTFSVSINEAIKIAQKLIAGETIRRSTMGIESTDLTDGDAYRLDLDMAGGGVIVSRTSPAGPGERAGLAVGDVITALDGVAVRDTYALTCTIANRPVASKAAVTYIRDGRRHETSVTLDEMRDPGAPAPETQPRAVDGRPPMPVIN